MELKLTLALPRDQLSVPLARRILKRSLDSLGIDDETVSDIELALTEACTNVLDHARGHDDYTVFFFNETATSKIEALARDDALPVSQNGLDAEAHPVV